jgi:hypothetical protein
MEKHGSWPVTAETNLLTTWNLPRNCSRLLRQWKASGGMASRRDRGGDAEGQTEEGQLLPRSSGTSSGGITVPVPGVDGSRWILEGVDGGEYHVVDRWSPPDNSYSQLCKYLFRLGRVEATFY